MDERIKELEDVIKSLKKAVSDAIEAETRNQVIRDHMDQLKLSHLNKVRYEADLHSEIERLTGDKIA